MGEITFNLGTREYTPVTANMYLNRLLEKRENSCYQPRSIKISDERGDHFIKELTNGEDYPVLRVDRVRYKGRTKVVVSGTLDDQIQKIAHMIERETRTLH